MEKEYMKFLPQTEPVKEPKFAFKGFTDELKCKDHQYVVGETYTKEEVKNLKTCTNLGFHYCNDLKKCFDYYSYNGKNRYCLVEILGSFVDDADGKSITTSIKVVSEISKKDIAKIIYEENINLPTIRKIQEHNPFIHVGGSAALYLHGLMLSRVITKKGETSDIDIVSPFYLFLIGDTDDKIEAGKKRASGNDFDETFTFNGVHVDMKIDNMQKYEVINHNGFNYKVSMLETVMIAKLQYSANGQEKHQKDCYELLRKTTGKIAQAIQEDEDFEF